MHGQKKHQNFKQCLLNVQLALKFINSEFCPYNVFMCFL